MKSWKPLRVFSALFHFKEVSLLEEIILQWSSKPNHSFFYSVIVNRSECPRNVLSDGNERSKERKFLERKFHSMELSYPETKALGNERAVNVIDILQTGWY